MDQVLDSEQLARFVFYRDHVRSGGEIKPDAFIPHPYDDLSVTRHDSLSQVELWGRGEAISKSRERPLVGLADVKAVAVRGAGLEPKPDPTPGDPQHAIILGWPSGKPNQKHQAQLLAKAAVFSKKPEIL